MDINPLIEKNIDLSKRLEKANEEIAELKVELHKYKSYYFARLGKLLKEDTP